MSTENKEEKKIDNIQKWNQQLEKKPGLKYEKKRKKQQVNAHTDKLRLSDSETRESYIT